MEAPSPVSSASPAGHGFLFRIISSLGGGGGCLLVYEIIDLPRVRNANQETAQLIK
jgi:hypothetical protein